MKTIYFIRHGETKWNILKKTQGQKNTKLTVKGREQARKAGNFLKGKNIDIIYSSDLARAYDTASIINEDLKKDIVKSKNLREINFGVWEGLSNEDLKKESSFEDWLKEPIKVKIEGAESLEDMALRAKIFLEYELDLKHDNILIVSHNAFLKVLILSFLDMDIKHFKNLKMDNTGISRIDIKDYNKVLNYYNSTEHLNK